MSTLYRPMVAIDGIQLRPMEPRDEAVFRRLYAEFREPELRVTGWSPAEKQSFCDSQYSLQDRHYRAHYADFEPWTICQNAAVIGRLYLASGEGMLLLMDITIAAAYRGKGIGSALMRDLVQQADQDRREMRLHVEPGNPAKRLYRRLGFIEVGEAGIYQEMRRAPGAPG